MKRRLIIAVPIVGVLVIALLVLLLSRPERHPAKPNEGSSEQPAVTAIPTNPAEAASSQEPGVNTTRLDARPGGARVRMEGTSTIHDWQVEGTVIGGHVEA